MPRSLGPRRQFSLRLSPANERALERIEQIRDAAGEPTTRNAILIDAIKRELRYWVEVAEAMDLL